MIAPFKIIINEVGRNSEEKTRGNLGKKKYIEKEKYEGREETLQLFR